MSKKKEIEDLITAGNKSIADKSWQEGLSIWKKLDGLLPDNAGILMNVSCCLSNIGKHNKSLEILNKVDKLLPLNPEVHYSKGSCYDFLKDYEEAIKSFTKCLDINKNHIDAWIRLALCHRRLHNPEKAIEIYKHILTSYEQKIEYVIELASALFEFEKYEEAENYLQQILNNDRDNELAKKTLSRIYHHTGRKSEAIQLEKDAEGSFTFST